jgi:hypothetical protein
MAPQSANLKCSMKMKDISFEKNYETKKSSGGVFGSIASSISNGISGLFSKKA